VTPAHLPGGVFVTATDDDVFTIHPVSSDAIEFAALYEPPLDVFFMEWGATTMYRSGGDRFRAAQEAETHLANIAAGEADR